MTYVVSLVFVITILDSLLTTIDVLFNEKRISYQLKLWQSVAGGFGFHVKRDLIAPFV